MTCWTSRGSPAARWTCDERWSTIRQIVDHAVHANEPLIAQRGHALEVALPEEPLHLDVIQRGWRRWSGISCTTPPSTRTPVGTWRRGARRRGRRGGDPGLGRRYRHRPSQLESIFELFVQVEPTADRAQGGLGLGLTLGLDPSPSPPCARSRSAPPARTARRCAAAATARGRCRRPSTRSRRRSPSAARRDAMLPAGVGVLGRVVQQVAHHLRQPRRVRVQRQRLLGELPPPARGRPLDQRPSVVHRGFHDRRTGHAPVADPSCRG